LGGDAPEYVQMEQDDRVSTEVFVAQIVKRLRGAAALSLEL
jgi:hypothetical protein